MQSGGRTFAGRYQLDGVIGRGGMSTVYRATDLVLGRTVAVKVLLAGLAEEDPTYVARFEREARSAAALAHRSVVTVYDTGTDDGEWFIVMEYVAGRSLAMILNEDGPLAPGEALRIAAQVADALAAAHAAGILHRDVKPANVMVADDGAVKVLDFGIARPLNEATLTQAASLVGTAAYMAPERALGEPGDARSDIYSLGCLLYAMLTGAPPFAGEISAAVLHQQINAEPRPPSAVTKGVPAAVDGVVLAMLAKSPDARPQTTTAVRDALASLAADPDRPVPPIAPVTERTVPLAGAVPLGRAAPPERTAATRVLQGSRRRRRPGRRAAVAALTTAAVALAAIALLSGGSSPKPSNAAHHAAGTGTSPPTRSTTTAATVPTTPTTTTTATAPSKPSKPPKPKGPQTGPPGQGGPPPGPDKHHGHGHGGGGG